MNATCFFFMEFKVLICYSVNIKNIGVKYTFAKNNLILIIFVYLFKIPLPQLR